VKLVSFGGGFFILLGERGVVDGSIHIPATSRSDHHSHTVSQVGVGVRRGDPPRLDEGADLSSSLRTVDVVFWLADDAGSIVYDGEARHSMQVVSWDKIDKQE
jgi:hypothetical protein